MVRDELMRKTGLRVLRFDNSESMRNMDAVMAMIETTVLESPHAPLLQRGDM